jgi:hypothetical protein
METLILAVLWRCSRQLLCFTLFAQYFLLNPVVFDQIKSGFLLWGRHFVTFINAEFMLKSGVFGE